MDEIAGLEVMLTSLAELTELQILLELFLYILMAVFQFWIFGVISNKQVVLINNLLITTVADLSKYRSTWFLSCTNLMSDDGHMFLKIKFLGDVELAHLCM